MAEETEKPKKSGGGIVIPALMITLIAAGGGGAFGALVLGNADKPATVEEAEKSEKKAAKKKKKKKKDSAKKKKGDKGEEKKAAAGEVIEEEKIIALPTIVANLNNQSKFWLRLETSIIAKAGTKPISDATQKRLAQDIISHIRQSRLEDFEGATGLINLRSDLSEVVRIRTKGRADELVVHGMIVE